MAEGPPDYGVGDLVAYRPEAWVCRHDELTPGAVYTVGDIWPPENVREHRWGISLLEIPLSNGEGFLASQFRKVDPLPPALTSLLVTRKVPVNPELEDA
jgi:hypothetical protein